MAEQIDLATPYRPDPRTAAYFRVSRITLDWGMATIVVGLTNGTVTKEVTWVGDTARTLMAALNKANLSTKSLHRRILERIQADGLLTGTISGTAE